MKRMLKNVAAAVASAAIAAGVIAAPAANAAPGPKITWEKCPPHVDAKGAQCGRINVPMQYDNPKAGNISLGFVKVPAQVPSARRGVIFGNPGGPGGDAYGYFGNSEQQLWPQELRNEWDLVAVQPRGLAHSTPLNCADPKISSPMDAVRLEIEANLNSGGVTRDLCERTRPGYTKTITTYNNARDWDMVRWALGEDKINIIGLSYGTYLGASYASMFPHRTDKVVLDSAMNPNDQYQKLMADQQGGYERALHEYFAWVALNNDKFKMGDTPLKAYQYWSNVVVRQTGTNPTVAPPPARVGDLPPALAFSGQAGANALSAAGRARVEGEGIVSRMLNPGANQANSELLGLTRMFLPMPAMWGTLAGLTNGSIPADQGGAPDPVMQREAETQQLAALQLQSVQFCNENLSPADPVLVPSYYWAMHTGDIFTMAPSGLGSGLACNGAPPVTGKVPLDGSKLAVRPLQINGTRDPQTLYGGRFGIANPMRSHLVTVHGPGHGHVGYGNPAVDRQVLNYLRTGELGPVNQPGFFEARRG